MTEKRKSFLIYIDTLPLFDELNDEDELSLCRAINHYHRNLPIERRRLRALCSGYFRRNSNATTNGMQPDAKRTVRAY